MTDLTNQFLAKHPKLKDLIAELELLAASEPAMTGVPLRVVYTPWTEEEMIQHLRRQTAEEFNLLMAEKRRRLKGALWLTFDNTACSDPPYIAELVREFRRKLRPSWREGPYQKDGYAEEVKIGARIY